MYGKLEGSEEKAVVANIGGVVVTAERGQSSRPVIVLLHRCRSVNRGSWPWLHSAEPRVRCRVYSYARCGRRQWNTFFLVKLQLSAGNHALHPLPPPHDQAAHYHIHGIPTLTGRMGHLVGCCYERGLQTAPPPHPGGCSSLGANTFRFGFTFWI
jgi:hypothetical protein